MGAKIESLFRDGQDAGREAEDGDGRDYTWAKKKKKRAEPVVTPLERPKHTQVNCYPYESVTARHRNPATTSSPTVTSAGDALGDRKAWRGKGENSLQEFLWPEG